MKQGRASRSSPLINRPFKQQAQLSVLRSSKSRTLERNPIKIVVEKIVKDAQLVPSRPSETVRWESKIDTPIVNTQYPVQKQGVRKNLCGYTSSHSIFDRYQYQNYENYVYPSHQKRKYSVINSIVQSKKNITKKPEQNIQIIYCSNKLPEFQRKTNCRIESIYKKQQTKNQFKTSNFKLMEERQSISLKKKKNQKQRLKVGFEMTLQRCLNDFNRLEKLSTLLEKDLKLKEQNTKDLTKTCLLDVVAHQISLRHMQKKQIYHLFKSLLNLQNININTKINIHQYILIQQMLVQKNASPHQTASFLCAFLFSHSCQNAIDKIKRLASASYYSYQADIIQALSDFDSLTKQQMVNRMSKDLKLQRQLLDLITAK